MQQADMTEERGRPPGADTAATSGQSDRHTLVRATLTVATVEHFDGLTAEQETSRQRVTQLPDSAMGADGPPNTDTLARRHTTRPQKEKKTHPASPPRRKTDYRAPTKRKGADNQMTILSGRPTAAYHSQLLETNVPKVEPPEGGQTAG